MDKPLISVIVPIYKVEKYLHKCINSIVSQTYKNLEIFLVDDGSPDNCGKICDNYAEEDSRITVIHKKNGGLSDARNVALDVMNGEYVILVDSDDYVANNYIEYLYDLICKYKAEIAVGPFIEFEEGKAIYINEEKIYSKVFDNYNALKSMFLQRLFDVSAWGKLYRSSLFNGIRYPKGYISEDIPTTYKLFLKATRVAYTNKILYYYLKREQSISGCKFNIATYKSFEYIQTHANDDIKSLESISHSYHCRLVSFYFNILLKTPIKSTYRKEIFKEIKKYRKEIIFKYDVRNKTRIACILSYLGQHSLNYFFKCIKHK